MISLLFLSTYTAHAYQRGDFEFTPQNTQVTYTHDNAPVVFLDEAHHNFHTANGRYQPFTKILTSDGYVVKRNLLPFSAESLGGADILVISNALNEKNINNWDLPNYSAFTRAEVEAIYTWVQKGGSLFLIADHMPFPKASESLAAIFGFQFNNGYAKNLNNKAQLFTRLDGTLATHAIFSGSNKSHKVDTVKAFTGQAFLSPPNAKPLLIFDKYSVSSMPSKSWSFIKNTPKIPVDGWHQGATLEFGKGRIVVFGEAAMFTAQVSGKQKFKMGVIAKGAEQNERFLLNIMLWLSKKI